MEEEAFWVSALGATMALLPLAPCGVTIDTCHPATCHRGTSLIRNNPLLGPYSRIMSRVLGGS